MALDVRLSIFSFPEQILETQQGISFISHTHIPQGGRLADIRAYTISTIMLTVASLSRYFDGGYVTQGSRYPVAHSPLAPCFCCGLIKLTQR